MKRLSLIFSGGTNNKTRRDRDGRGTGHSKTRAKKREWEQSKTHKDTHTLD